MLFVDCCVDVCCRLLFVAARFCSLPVACRCFLFVGCGWLVVRCCLCMMPAVCVFVARRSLFDVRCWQLVVVFVHVRFLLCIVVVCCALFVVCWLLLLVDVSCRKLLFVAV